MHDMDEYTDIASWIEQQFPPDTTSDPTVLADLLDALPDLPELDRASSCLILKPTTIKLTSMSIQFLCHFSREY